MDPDALANLQQACTRAGTSSEGVRREFAELESTRGENDYFRMNARHCPKCLARNHPMLFFCPRCRSHHT
eukprot:2770740-Alexandrium_andersonii.AAC.1